MGGAWHTLLLFMLNGSSSQSSQMVEATGSQPLPAHGRILVIDNDDTCRAGEWLQAMGYEVMTERSGLSGAARLMTEVRRALVHGVLLNVQMPHVEATIASELRNNYSDIPLMVMAETGQIDKLRTAVTQGAREYLVKPIDRNLFEQKCRRIFVPSQTLTPKKGQETASSASDVQSQG